MSENLKVEVMIEEDTGIHYIQTIGKTLPPDMFMKIAQECEKNNPLIKEIDREIILPNGERKKRAIEWVYKNTGAKFVNFTDEATIYEAWGVILELDPKSEIPNLYYDGKRIKEHYNDGAFGPLFNEELGLVEGEDEENIRKIETYIRVMKKEGKSPEIHTQLQLDNMFTLGALSVYFGELIIQNIPNSKWLFSGYCEMELSVETIEGSRFVINPLVALECVYSGKNIRLLDIWERLVSLAGTKMSPFLVELMKEHDLTKEEAAQIAQKALEKMFEDDLSSPVVDSTVKVERNDLCPCGSGKKYKKCCLNAKEDKENTMVQFVETTGMRGNKVTVAYVEKNGDIEVLGKHYTESGLCWWAPTEVRHTIEDVEEWKKLVIGNTRAHLGI